MPRNRAATAEEPRQPSPRSAPAAMVTMPAALPARLADSGLILGFLALTFLLGMFPLKDTDFWWHLRTGDLIRQSWRTPVQDWYTFGAADHFWIDLHWGFEVLLSWGYQHAGVVGLNLAKCAITCLALGLLILARRRDWPVWVMVLAWLPALFVLSGRMYLRPETLSLLYLSVFLVVLSHWQRHPRLAYILPAVAILWVNTQGLFVLGLAVLAFAWVDAALTPGAFAKSRRSWWRAAGIATGLTAAACVLNPYGMVGALFPIQLARTMANPIFEQTIAELMPVLSFVDEMGIRNLPLQLHLATLVLGALSFVIPITWRAFVRVTRPADPAAQRSGKTRRTRKTREKEAAAREETWRLSPFRVLLFAAFSLLGFKATRNTHQFAAVVGCVTAWNFGEWGAAVRRVRALRGGVVGGSMRLGRLATLACLVAAFVAVASGRYYLWAGEGRTIGSGEEPLWFPHEAARFAGQPGMPERFVCFHNGHAGLFEYYNGPDRKVFADARLEVIGPEVYKEFINLEKQISGSRPGWTAALDAMGSPGVLVDNVHTEFAAMSASLLSSSDWRCVWFDPIAAVFVREKRQAFPPRVDFLERLFQRRPGLGPQGADALRSSAKGLYNVAYQLAQKSSAGSDQAHRLALLGLDHARRARDADPKRLEGWKYLGLLESLREPLGSFEKPIPRFRHPWDPVFDLSPARATYALRQALERAPEDSMSLLALAALYQARGMNEAALPLWEHMAAHSPTNQKRAVTSRVHGMAIGEAARLRAMLGPEPSAAWKNMDDLDLAVDARLETGRAAGVSDLLARAYRPGARPWDVSDRLATIQLHLGFPAAARTFWQGSQLPARPALLRARVAASYLVEGDFPRAREAYRGALAVEPGMFETLYGLAVLERDAGRAREALDAAQLAEQNARTDVAREAARAIVETVERYTSAPPTEK